MYMGGYIYKDMYTWGIAYHGHICSTKKYTWKEVIVKTAVPLHGGHISLGVIDCSAVVSDSELSIGATALWSVSIVPNSCQCRMVINLRERLSTSSNSLDILTARQALMSLKILEESHQISTEIRNLTLDFEREDRRIAIGSLVQIPLCSGWTSDGKSCRNWDSTLRTVSRGDRPCATESGKPDHNFVLVRAAKCRGCEHVIADVCN